MILWQLKGFAGYIDALDPPYRGMCHNVPPALDGSPREFNSIQLGTDIAVCYLYHSDNCGRKNGITEPSISRITQTTAVITYLDNRPIVRSIRCFEEQDYPTGPHEYIGQPKFASTC